MKISILSHVLGDQKRRQVIYKKLNMQVVSKCERKYSLYSSSADVHGRLGEIYG